MAKIRINKLALELNIQNDQIIDALHEKDIPVKNYMSSIDGETANYIRELFDPELAAAKAKSKAVKAKTKITVKTAAKKVIKAPAKAKAKAKTVKKAAPKKTAKTAVEKKVSTAQSELTPLLELKSKPRKISKTVKPTGKKAVAEIEPAKAPKKHGLKIVKKEDKPREAAKKPKSPNLSGKNPNLRWRQKNLLQPNHRKWKRKLLKPWKFPPIFMFATWPIN